MQCSPHPAACPGLRLALAARSLARSGSPRAGPAPAGARLATPEQFLGFPVGADNKLARWDKIVDYMRMVAAGIAARARPRTRARRPTGNPFIAVEISAPDTLKNLDRFKQLAAEALLPGRRADRRRARRDLPVAARRSSLVTCNIHATEIGASQMVLELVHRLATDDSPLVQKILDNVILLLVPSLNPDGQIMVTDWFNKNLGTEFETSPLPVALPPVRRPRQQPRHVHVHAEGEPAHGAAAVARLVPVGLARRAPDGQHRRAHLRDAGDRPDQPERAPADLPVERHPRPVAGRGARGGRQGRHHLQLHLHELLAGRDGVERLVAQPGRAC